MYAQDNTLDIAIAERLNQIERKFKEDAKTHREFLLEVYQQNLWKHRNLDSFKQWVMDYTPYGGQYNSVLNWVISDQLRATLSGWGINASKWSDRAVLALSSAPDDLLEEIAMGLPTNPNEAQVKDALGYTSPSNLLHLPTSNAPTAKKPGGYSKVNRELEEIVHGNHEKMTALEQENLELREKLQYQKDTVTQHAGLHVQKDEKPSSVLEDAVERLRRELEESEIARRDMAAQLEAVLNNTPGPAIDDEFDGKDKDKVIAKQARQIESLQAQVERLQQQLADRSGSDLQKQLSIAKGQAKYYSDILDGLDNPELLERITNNQPKDEASLLQFELNKALESIQKQGAIIIDLEKKNKELLAKSLKVDELERSVQNLREMMGTPAPKPSSKLPEEIKLAIDACESRGYKVMAHRSPEGDFVIVDGEGTRAFADIEDALDFLYESLDQYAMTA